MAEFRTCDNCGRRFPVGTGEKGPVCTLSHNFCCQGCEEAWKEKHPRKKLSLKSIVIWAIILIVAFFVIRKIA